MNASVHGNRVVVGTGRRQVIEEALIKSLVCEAYVTIDDDANKIQRSSGLAGGAPASTICVKGVSICPTLSRSWKTLLSIASARICAVSCSLCGRPEISHAMDPHV